MCYLYLEAFDSAIALNNKNIDALKGKGQALIAQDEFENAIQWFDRVVEMKPEDKESWVSKAEAYVSMGRFEGAIGCYDKAIDLDEHSKSLWINKGMLLERIANYEESIKCYDRALDIDDKDGNIWHRKGMALAKTGDMDGAIGCYDRALGLVPKSKQIWTSKGQALNNLDNYEQALRCFEHALELDSKFLPAVEGKEKAEKEIRNKNIERYAREILKFEKDAKRAPTKEEAFKVCHIPYSYLDSVVEYLKSKEEIDINLLSTEERNKLERDSNAAIVGALKEDPASFERFGLRLSDIVLGFPDYDINQAKRLLAYINKVDAMEITVDEVDSELEELLHRALEFPPNKRTLTALVEELRLGIYEAKRVHSVVQRFSEEEILSSPEARVRSLDEDHAPGGPSAGEPLYEPEGFLEPVDVEEEEEVIEEDMCLICDKNEAQLQHDCGALLCMDCLAEYNKRYAKLYDLEGGQMICPKCNKEIKLMGNKKGDYIRL